MSYVIITCPDCGMSYQVGRKCRCFAPALPPVPPPRKSGRRPKGSVKEIVVAAIDRGMTAPQLAKTTGLSRYTIYNAATRLGLRLRSAR